MFGDRLTRFQLFPLVLLSLLLASFASAAFAHVRWFVDETATLETFEPYAFGDVEVLAWIAVSAMLIGASVLLDLRLPAIRVVATKTRHDFIEILRVFTGMSLLLTAYEGAIVAPHLVTYGSFGTALLFAQAGIGILLIANRFVRHAALLMILLHLGLAINFGLLAALEYLIMVAIAVFLLINNLPTQELRERFKPYSVDLLRILTGISLIALGFSEKLFGALMAESFLAQYQWNFMQALGFEFFTDRLFALSAGFMEVVFGIILVLGTTTRLNVLAFSMVLFASNVLFILQGENEAAMVEFIGHMPVIGVALILLLLGSGQRLKVTNFLPQRRVNTATTTLNVESHV
ncbi:MAG: DoxX family membrane protein [Pseudomonadota bacterium]